MKPTLDLRLYLVTDARMMPYHRLEKTLEALIRKGGVSAVQLRDKTTKARELVDVARRLKAILRPSGVPLIVNDRVDVALAAAADGVHLGQEDLPVREARRLIGPHGIVGVSIESPDRTPPASAAGADYVAVSPVFGISTPTNPHTPFGLDGIAAVRARTELPLVGIGGVNAETARAVVEAGADGVAVVSAILAAPDPVDAAARIALAVEGARAEPDRIPNVLTIAGSDSGGGAGVQADLKTFSALGTYGASVVTALTAQNTQMVFALHDVPAAFVAAQLDAVFEDLEIHAVKIGMLSQESIIRVVAAALARHRPAHVVLDPVMVAKSGARLLAPEAVDALVTELIPWATVLTPNLAETGVLLRRKAPESLSEMEGAALALAERGSDVLVKGGHLDGVQSVDVLVHAGQVMRYAAPRISTRNTHGTGCTLSSAIAAHLARGLSVPAAVDAAKRYVARAIGAAAHLTVGSGHGPVHHFFALWRRPPRGLRQRRTTPEHR